VRDGCQGLPRRVSEGTTILSKKGGGEKERPEKRSVSLGTREQGDPTGEERQKKQKTCSSRGKEDWEHLCSRALKKKSERDMFPYARETGGKRGWKKKESAGLRMGDPGTKGWQSEGVESLTTAKKGDKIFHLGGLQESEEAKHV